MRDRRRLAPYFACFLISSVLFVSPPRADAQTPARDWDALFERRDGWLGADGIYSVDLARDAARPDAAPENADRRTLFWFSDTTFGSTRDAGCEFDGFAMTSHSFAFLDGTAPRPENAEFIWRKDDSDVLGVKRWLQDGARVGDRIWLSAILVGEGWKPARIDAVSIGLDADGRPDFDDVNIDDRAPLSWKTDDRQLVFGAAVCDDADDGFIYVYGYCDVFKAGSRKDLVVARVKRDNIADFTEWRWFDGENWTPNLADAARPSAAVVKGVSAEFSVSKIPVGKYAGKFLLVYTPGVISPKIAFRVGATPFGPFGPEVVFYESPVPREIRGVRCYNAKAHPVFSDSTRILTSYNVNRLGALPRRPAEYRPRFVWLDWATIDAAPDVE